MAHTLEDAGYAVIGPFENVADSLEAIAAQMPDGAILDVQLDGEDVELVANSLNQNGVPIVFHSGHAKPCELEARYPDSRFCGKPCTPTLLIDTVADALESAAARTA